MFSPTTVDLSDSIIAQLRRRHGTHVRHLPRSSSLTPNPREVQPSEITKRHLGGTQRTELLKVDRRW
ncbi:hypothetical protein CMV_006578 [Castanea mollissima]|uniref:Uncharacterized protein n=1 Tax=Castanea mollissima TaxID=60419 RepID=A0A8J4W3G5_9ROSI|nr:hypothetical protein CMV_006578 [Castanea mollissima]